MSLVACAVSLAWVLEPSRALRAQGIPDSGKHEDNRNYEHGENSDEENPLDDSPNKAQDEHEKIQGERF